MIVPVNLTNLHDAAVIHSLSWQESHKSFCSAEFVALHSPEHQEAYLLQKMKDGSRIFMLINDVPIGIVSLKDSLIEDLYVHPDYQGRGFGSALLQYAIGQCSDTPILWILENNTRARKLYLRAGFRETGRRNEITEKLDEIEFALQIRYKTASAEDIELLMQSRMEMLRTVNHLGDDHQFDDVFLEASRRFFIEGDQETILAFDGNMVIGCATMCYLEMMPTFAHPSGKRAHLMNVYTIPSRRREGIAYQMVSMLIDAAWKRGVTEISLDATESGRPLYWKLGFKESDECMILDKQ